MSYNPQKNYTGTFTPTLNWSGLTIYPANYSIRPAGNTYLLTVHIYFYATAGLSAAGQLLINPHPNGWQHDADFVPGNESLIYGEGTLWDSNPGTMYYNLRLVRSSDTQLGAIYPTSVTAMANLTNTAPITVATSDAFQFIVKDWPVKKT